jgi:hypothetical protein
MPTAVATRHRTTDVDSEEPFAASFVDVSGPDGAVLTINRNVVLTIAEHDVAEGWGLACHHDTRRFALLSSADLASLVLLG